MASSSHKVGPFGSIQNKIDENQKKAEQEKKEKKERERAAQEQFWREVLKRNQEREEAKKSMTGLMIEGSDGGDHEDHPRPATSLMGYMEPGDTKKEMRSISSARLPSKCALDVPAHTNRSATSEPIPEHGDLLPSPAHQSLSVRSEEPPFNLPQVSDKKAKKIDDLNISQKRQDAENTSIERSSDWDGTIGSGHSSVGPSPVPETARVVEKQPAETVPEIKVEEPPDEQPKPIGNGTKESPIDLNAVPFEPAEEKVPEEHLVAVQKSRCCCIQ